MIPVHGFTKAWPKINDLAILGTPEIPAIRIVLADVNAIDESELSAEIRREIVVVRGKSEMPAGIGGIGPQGIPLLRADRWIARCERQAILSSVEILPRPGVYGLNISDPVLGELEACIERSHAIAGVREIAAGKKTANVGLLAKLTGHAHDAIGRTRVVGTGGESETRLAVIDRQRPEGPFAKLSRHTAAELRVGDLPGKEQIDGRHEKTGIFNEERTLFRKENGKALIHGHLRVVGFHLAEIRIQRHVKRQRILQDKLRVQAGAMFKVVLKERRRSRIRRVGLRRLIQEVIAGQQAIRNELDIAAGGNFFQAAHGREL